jgi:ornithine carbamoyltransferase
MLHANCRVIDAKAFLLHAQNAALEWVFRKI